jgi:hypothetical protein
VDEFIVEGGSEEAGIAIEKELETAIKSSFRKAFQQDAEFEIAPGDENDIKVTNMYPWGSEWLVFEDGTAAATAPFLGHRDTAAQCSNQNRNNQ